MKKWLSGLKTILAVGLVCLMTVQVFADNLDDAKQDQQDAEDNKANAENVLNGLKGEQAEVQDKIYELDGQLTELETRIDDLNKQKADLESQIETKQAELEQAKQNEQTQYAEMCTRIQYMYENGDEDYVSALMDVNSMSDMLNEPEYVSAMADYDYNMLETLIQIRETIANDEQLLENDLAEVESITAQVQEEESAVSQVLDEKNAEMAKYDQMIADQQKLVEQYDAEIQAAAARIAEIEEAARKAREQGGGGGTAGGGEYVPYQGGALTWPCPSSYRINSGFGTREASGVVTANHYGIDIGCPDGTPIVAAASGVVVLAQRSAPAGNWIIISHGDGLYTIYMHASVLYVSAGQYVNAGDTIMLSGATGATQGRHLHFEVRVGGYQSSRYSVNPMNYY